MNIVIFFVLEDVSFWEEIYGLWFFLILFIVDVGLEVELCGCFLRKELFEYVLGCIEVLVL